MKILIAEDNPVSAKQLDTIVSSLGERLIADTGVSATNAFDLALESGKPYDLVFLDISMPFMNGDEVLKEIRKSERLKEISHEQQAIIIMVTSYRKKKIVEICIKNGCDGYIVKPFNKATIFEQLKQAGINISEDSPVGSTKFSYSKDAAPLEANAR